VDEFELIRRYFARAGRDSSIVLGIGDDGAIVRPDADRELVIVIDTMVEGVHYPAGLDPSDIGYRAVAVNLSDIAAMAARPRWMTLALTLAGDDAGWLDGFSRGLFDCADEFSLALIGGDTTRGDQTVITVQISGDVIPSQALRRSGAKPGDEIYVTGTPGDAAAGLALWQSNNVRSEYQRQLLRRFARPAPRVALAAELAAHASAAIDVSDGLFADIEKLLVASGTGGVIEIDDLPLSAALVAVHGQAAAIELALGGGDDYEIVFTAAPVKASAIAELAGRFSVPISRIGAVTRGEALQCTRAGREFAYRHAGYRHFEEASDD
jgi:thiamine-monophosphate kinase